MPPASPSNPDTVIFDLGGVLLDWNPRYLYRGFVPSLLPDEAAMERFLAEVVTMAWNHRQDEGRPWEEGIAELVAAHPEQRELIVAFHERWDEMLGGEMPESVAILAELRAAGVPIYAITNWSSETFNLTRPKFPFLGWFRDIVVSGDEGVAKPDPRLFRVLFERNGLDPRCCVLVDDVAANVAAAASLGVHAVQFRDAATFRADLVRLGLPIRGEVAAGR